jgi:hypothetical protein
MFDADVDSSAVVEVFRLVWPGAEVHVLPAAPDVAVVVTLGSLSHCIVLPPALAAEGSGLSLAREICKRRVPDTLADAWHARTLTLAFHVMI